MEQTLSFSLNTVKIVTMNSIGTPHIEFHSNSNGFVWTGFSKCRLVAVLHKLLFTACCFLLVAGTLVADEWVSVFDGKTTTGWKANEKPESFSVENGELRMKGGMAHLFCEKEGYADLKNFEFKAEVKTLPGANSGVFFHTENRGPGGLKKGYEAQINTSFVKDLRKTGSLVDVKDLDKSPVKDNEWFEFHLVVNGKKIAVNINGEPVVEYTEEDKPVRKKGREERLLSHGPIALQAHDPESTTYFRNIRIKKLPD